MSHKEKVEEKKVTHGEQASSTTKLAVGIAAAGGAGLLAAAWLGAGPAAIAGAAGYLAYRGLTGKNTQQPPAA